MRFSLPLCHVLALSLGLPGPAGRAVEAGARLLVANKADHTLSIVDAATGREIAVVAEEGNTGHEVAASPDGRSAIVPIYGDSGVGRPGTDGEVIRIIDLETHALRGSIALGRGLRPHGAVFGPQDGLLYVTTELENSVTVIDPATGGIRGAIPTGAPQSHMLAISADNRRGYTANVRPGSISVLDLEQRTLVKVIPVSAMIQRVSLAVDGRRLFTADQTSYRIVVIDTGTNEIVDSIPVPATVFSTAPTPDGKGLVVSMPSVSQVGYVDLAARKLTRVLDVPKSPQAVLVRPDGAVAYTSCDSSKQVVEIDLASFRVSRLIAVGGMCDGLAWVPAR